VTKLRKTVTSSTCSGIDRGLGVTNGAIGLKLLCWRKVDALNTKCDADCNEKNTDFDCLKCSLNFFFLCKEIIK